MDWNEVKAKPKRVKKHKDAEDEGFYGGGQGNKLNAGPVKGGGTSGVHHGAANKQASAIADYDFIKDENEEIKFETISHECAAAIQAARLAKELSQAQLAHAVNEKTGLIVDLEHGTAAYNADVINRIERVLGVKIPRGRGTKKNKKKKPAQPTF